MTINKNHVEFLQAFPPQENQKCRNGNDIPNESNCRKTENELVHQENGNESGCQPQNFLVADFEISVWAPVPVPPRQRKKHRKPRKEKPSTTEEVIDFHSHLTPGIRGIPKNRFLYTKKERELTPLSSAPSTHVGLCPISLKTVELSEKFPDLMFYVLDFLRAKPIDYSKILELHVHRPTGIVYQGCNPRMIQGFLLQSFKPQTIPTAKFFCNNVFMRNQIYGSAKARRMLGVLFERHVHLRAAVELYKLLSSRLTQEELYNNGYLHVRKIKPFNALMAIYRRPQLVSIIITSYLSCVG
ncbi:hypothetical protein CRE_19186 [Caenorhabditis remanei]|uniref:Uncharacterized protein n=1 Tax=Caenorhabditis remanei TaxID=31234 RepID=E3MJT3_CAERE|nr:hypothetical protein CRE_19186 [Caenorhabditis remanei]